VETLELCSVWKSWIFQAKGREEVLLEAGIFMKLANRCSELLMCFGGSSCPVMLHLEVCDQFLAEGFVFVWFNEFQNILVS